MIYTSYEMIRDCRAGKPEGWSYFETTYVPIVRALLGHYFPENPPDAARAVAQLRNGFFQELDPIPERVFITRLRQRVLAAVDEGAPPEITIELETLSKALEPLTLTERLAVWFETMGYGAAHAARMMRMSAETAAKIRARASELIRANVDSWSAAILADNGAWLGRAAAAASTKDCLPAKAFLDVIDGRTTWRGREEMERHAKYCWCCIDHYGRLLEAVDIQRAR